MKRKLAALLLGSVFAPAAAAPTFAGDPKFGPHDSSCQGPNDQPNCPGNH